MWSCSLPVGNGLHWRRCGAVRCKAWPCRCKDRVLSRARAHLLCRLLSRRAVGSQGPSVKKGLGPLDTRIHACVSSPKMHTDVRSMRDSPAPWHLSCLAIASGHVPTRWHGCLAPMCSHFCTRNSRVGYQMDLPMRRLQHSHRWLSPLIIALYAPPTTCLRRIQAARMRNLKP